MRVFDAEGARFLDAVLAAGHRVAAEGDLLRIRLALPAAQAGPAGRLVRAGEAKWRVGDGGEVGLFQVPVTR